MEVIVNMLVQSVINSIIIMITKDNGIHCMKCCMLQVNSNSTSPEDKVASEVF